MSRKGNCWDKVAKGFLKALKVICHQEYVAIPQAKLVVFKYIEGITGKDYTLLGV